MDTTALLISLSRVCSMNVTPCEKVAVSDVLLETLASLGGRTDSGGTPSQRRTVDCNV